jgi:hypothetical protein
MTTPATELEHEHLHDADYSVSEWVMWFLWGMVGGIVIGYLVYDYKARRRAAQVQAAIPVILGVVKEGFRQQAEQQADTDENAAVQEVS